MKKLILFLSIFLSASSVYSQAGNCGAGQYAVKSPDGRNFECVDTIQVQSPLTQEGSGVGIDTTTNDGVATRFDLIGKANIADPLSQFAATTSAELAGVISDETGNGSLVFNNTPTLMAPSLGTPTALVGTNITGTASGFTAGNVTTNANLTGDVTSVGNATTISTNAVDYSMMQVMTTDKLLGSGSGTAVAEITLGTGLSFTGTTLNAAGADNLYTADGALTASRIVTLGGNPLLFTGGQTTLKGEFATSGTKAFEVKNSSDVIMFDIKNNSSVGIGATASTSTALQIFNSAGVTTVLNVFNNASTLLLSCKDDQTVIISSNNTASSFGFGAVNASNSTVNIRSRNTTANHFALQVFTTSSKLLIGAYNDGNITLGDATLTTSSVKGFPYIPAVSGVPTGTPTTKTGYQPLIVDDTNSDLYFHDGNNWKPSGLLHDTVNLTSAQILNLSSIPVLAIAAPGAGYVISVVSASAKMTFLTAAYATSTIIGLCTATAALCQFTNSNLIGSASTILQHISTPVTGSGTQLVDNQALNITAPIADPTTGGGSLEIYITYELIKL